MGKKTTYTNAFRSFAVGSSRPFHDKDLIYLYNSENRNEIVKQLKSMNLKITVLLSKKNFIWQLITDHAVDYDGKINDFILQIYTLFKYLDTKKTGINNKKH